jgi:hypothetical protein
MLTSECRLRAEPAGASNQAIELIEKEAELLINSSVHVMLRETADFSDDHSGVWRQPPIRP